MKAVRFFLASLLLIIFSPAYGDELDACNSVEACIQRVYEIAEPPESKYHEVSKAEWAVAKKLATFGDAAVGLLVPMLKDSREDVAQIAAAALRNIESIDEKYLLNIVAALDSDYDLGWLPPALGRIDSPKAAKEAVRRFVGSQSAPHNQEAYAVKLTGQRAIPHIIQAAQCSELCGRDDH